MRIVVVDGQGGGIGRLLVEKLKARLGGHTLIAVGTNALATSAMLRAGADAGATGENAVLFNCKSADVLLGPAGVAVPDAMLGEISPRMAEAVQNSPAHTLLLMMDRCVPRAGGQSARPIGEALDELVEAAVRYAARQEER